MAVAVPATSMPEPAAPVEGNLHGCVGSASSGLTTNTEELSYSARTNASCSTVTEPIAMHSLVANLLAHDARLQTQSRLAKELEAELEQVKTSAVQLEVALARANVVIHEREVDLADANMIIHEHEGEIHRLREELDFETCTGSDLRRQLQERDAEITRLRDAAQSNMLRVNERFEQLQSRANKLADFKCKLRNSDAFVRQLESLAKPRCMDDSSGIPVEASPEDWRLLMHELGLGVRDASGSRGREEPGDAAALDHDLNAVPVQQVNNGAVDQPSQELWKDRSDAVKATDTGDSVAAVARHRCEDIGSSQDASFMPSEVSGETLGNGWKPATTDEYVKDDAGYEAQKSTSPSIVPALPTLRLQSPPLVNQVANLAPVMTSHDHVDPATSLSARASQALSRANSDCSMASSVAGVGLATRAVPTSGLTPRLHVRPMQSPKGDSPPPPLGWTPGQQRALVRGSSPADLSRTCSQQSVSATDEERGTLISWAYAPTVDSPVAKGRASGNRVDDKIADANGVKPAGIASSKASHTQSLGSLGSPSVRSGHGGTMLTVLRQQPRARASTGSLSSSYQRFPSFGTNGAAPFLSSHTNGLILGATPTGSPSSSPSSSPLRRVIVAPPPVVTQSASSLVGSRRTL